MKQWMGGVVTFAYEPIDSVGVNDTGSARPRVATVEFQHVA